MTARSVLLVDEDQDSLAIYSLMLGHHGFSVSASRGGEEALRMAEDGHPDVVVTELHVRGVDDISLAEQLKRNPRTSGIPLLAVTSFPVRTGRHAAALAVCDAHLAKPCSPSRLLAEVERLTAPSLSAPLSA